MANGTKDELLDTFFKIAGVSGGGGITGAQMGPEAMGTAAATSVGGNTHGGSASGGTSPSSDGGGSAILSVAKTVLESGMGIVPLVTGLFGLFEGGGEEKPQFQKYQMPQSISFDSADAGGRLVAADRDQRDLPRSYDQDSSRGADVARTDGPQITVNVQAIDARSFMDYSSEIAQAVRGAMLNMSSINDVVGEL